MANALTTAQKQQTGIATYLGGDAVRKNIAGVIGKENVTRFVSSVVSAVQANPQLAKCTNASILSAALQGDALNLAPSQQLGQFFMVPYKNRKKVGNGWQDVDEAQFQLGWKGYLQLAIRSGQYENIVVSEVKEGEIDYNPITEEMDIHYIADPAAREAAETVGYYAAFKLVTGFRKQIFWPKEAMESHAKRYSKGYRYDLERGKSTSPWSTNFDAMAKKTMIRQLISKWGIMSVDMQQAYTNDMAVIDDDGQARYVDNDQNLEATVQEEIEINANTVDFDETEVIEAEVVEAKPAPVKEHAKEPAKKPAADPVRDPAKKSTAKAKKDLKPEPRPEPQEQPVNQQEEPAPSVIDIPEGDLDEEPDWGV